VTDSRFFSSLPHAAAAVAPCRCAHEDGICSQDAAFRAIIAMVSQRSGLTAKTPFLDGTTLKAAPWFILGVIA